MRQADLFGALEAPSTSPIVGLRVELPRACRACGSSIGVIGSGCGPHAARVRCYKCNTFCQWLSIREAIFIEEVARKFGRPQVIALRGYSS
jgi:hypothetical protein